MRNTDEEDLLVTITKEVDYISNLTNQSSTNVRFVHNLRHAT